MTDYEEREYRSYNDFFTRKVKPGHRKFDSVKENFCAPCDSRLSIYPITAEGKVRVKDTEYTMESLFRSRKIARHYEGGKMCIRDRSQYPYCLYEGSRNGRPVHWTLCPRTSQSLCCNGCNLRWLRADDYPRPGLQADICPGVWTGSKTGEQRHVG